MSANRARSDPSTVKGSGSTIYPATAPLVFHKDLARSSRFHATNLEIGKAPLMHPSPCTLKTDVGTSGCDGNPSCACTTGATCNSCASASCPDGTDPFVRIKYFYTPGGTGEVAAAGYQDPWGVMDGWVDEAAGADGHRMIVDGSSYGLVGFGHSSGTTGACWPTFDVGDFASAKPAPAKIASAAPKPYGGNAGTFRVYATWNDKTGGAPKDLSASVDGKCTALVKELGDDKLNATYYADVPLTAGCHPVFIVGPRLGRRAPGLSDDDGVHHRGRQRHLRRGDGAAGERLRRGQSRRRTPTVAAPARAEPVAAPAAAEPAAPAAAAAPAARAAPAAATAPAATARAVPAARAAARPTTPAAATRSAGCAMSLTSTHARARPRRRRALPRRDGRHRHSPAKVAARSVSGGRT